ncbi:MAG: TRAP transporter small permease subunit [Prochlorothrix sp.]|nr:TRAP transporter small permease subunit [Prochlorothrix sp.]
MSILLRVMRWIHRFNRGVGQLTAWLCVVMVALGAWNVVGRYVGRAIGQSLSSNTLIESQWYLFDLVFLLGATYALQADDFVRVDVLYSRFSPKGKAWANLIGTVLFLLPFCGLVLFHSWDVVASSWVNREMSPDPGGLPRYPIKAMILVSLILLILQGIADVIQNVAIILGQLRLDAPIVTATASIAPSTSELPADPIDPGALGPESTSPEAPTPTPPDPLENL